MFKKRKKGMILGQALADALGLGTEFMTVDQVKKNYPKFPYNFSDIVDDNHRNGWLKGDWTDDTDQSIILFNTVKNNLHLTAKEIGIVFSKNLKRWLEKGLLSIDTCGVGVGKPVAWVLRDENYDTDPYKASKTVWETSEKSLAEDGAVMRTAFLSSLEIDWEKLKEIVISCCQITHWDSRCIACCLFVNYIIYKVLRTENVDKNFIEKIFNEAYIEVCKSVKKTKNFSKYLKVDTLDSLNLDNPYIRCHTKSPFRCFIWSLKNYELGYETIIWEIIKRGGDADTNAAVSGALLGAIFPEEVEKNINLKDLLYKDFLFETFSH